MQRRFILHARPNSPIIERVRATAGEPIAIITKDWVEPIRIVPSIQFFPESRELIEGEEAIDVYLETLRPRPMARERVPPPPPIKTRVESHETPTPKVTSSEVVPKEDSNNAIAKPKPVPRKKKTATK